MRNNVKIDDVTGVILAGGRSKRMGRDKAMLEVNGGSMFDNMLHVMQTIFSQVVIAGDRHDLTRPEVPCYPDHYPGSALGGLHTGLSKAKTDLIFAASCDMPFPDQRIIRLILRHANGYDAVIPRTAAGLEPIFALYRKTCLKHMQDMLKKNEYRIYDFFPKVRVRYVDEQELPDGWENALLNINTPKEYESLRKEK